MGGGARVQPGPRLTVPRPLRGRAPDVQLSSTFRTPYLRGREVLPSTLNHDLSRELDRRNVPVSADGAARESRDQREAARYIDVKCRRWVTRYASGGAGRARLFNPRTSAQSA